MTTTIVPHPPQAPSRPQEPEPQPDPVASFGRVYRVSEAARILGKGRDQVLKLLHDGQIAGVDTGPAGWRIHESALRAYLRAGKEAAAPPTPVVLLARAVARLARTECRTIARERHGCTDPYERASLAEWLADWQELLEQLDALANRPAVEPQETPQEEVR